MCIRDSPCAAGGVLRRPYAELTGYTPGCQVSRWTEVDVSALDIPSKRCYFINKAAAACAAPVLHKFCSICTTFCSLHRIRDWPQTLAGKAFEVDNFLPWWEAFASVPICFLFQHSFLNKTNYLLKAQNTSDHFVLLFDSHPQSVEVLLLYADSWCLKPVHQQ